MGGWNSGDFIVLLKNKWTPSYLIINHISFLVVPNRDIEIDKDAYVDVGVDSDIDVALLKLDSRIKKIRELFFK